jgi:hypothetical protein
LHEHDSINGIKKNLKSCCNDEKKHGSTWNNKCDSKKPWIHMKFIFWMVMICWWITSFKAIPFITWMISYEMPKFRHSLIKTVIWRLYLIIHIFNLTFKMSFYLFTIKNTISSKLQSKDHFFFQIYNFKVINTWCHGHEKLQESKDKRKV